MGQIGQHLGCASEVMVLGETVGGDDGFQTSGQRRFQTVAGVLKGDALRCLQAQARQGLCVHLGVGFFLRRGRRVFNDCKQVFPIGSYRTAQQHRDVDRRNARLAQGLGGPAPGCRAGRGRHAGRPARTGRPAGEERGMDARALGRRGRPP